MENLVIVIRNDFERLSDRLLNNRDYKPIRQQWWVQELAHIVNWIDVSGHWYDFRCKLWYHLADFKHDLRTAEGPKKTIEDLWRRLGWDLDMLSLEIEKLEVVP